ncbi:unnamed protein product [Arabis nemorensis]|uniref:Uncharacterized protein n=1 Tax=Arabis nemorensis TaxID=586526 RepID=A0A565B7Y7_9BRAS|nr:unnamed protein product [Arabis nemorensis]
MSGIQEIQSLVLAGVAVCTVTDVSVNLNGFLAAAIAVWSTALQQLLCTLSTTEIYSLGSFNLLAHTVPVQAASLLLVGPFLDYWLTNQRVDAYNFSFVSLMLCSLGIDKKQQICLKTCGYDQINHLSEDVLRLRKISGWRLMWRKIMMMKQKKKTQIFDHRVRYDPFTYSQNFAPSRITMIL